MSGTVGARTVTCPFGANCSCVFSASWQAEHAIDDTLRESLRADELGAEVTNWTDRGWAVISSDSREVILERRLGLGFCLNVLLCLATGLLWLAYWIPRTRHPKIDTKVITLAPDGTVSVTGRTERR